jgi:hypothetical protein
MMEKHQKSTRTKLAVMVSLFMAMIAISLPIASVTAQGAPTATPSDPVWLGFATARDAVQEAENVDLRIVRSWEFIQDDWSTANALHPAKAAGIDGCVSTVAIFDARPIYYGWTYTITSLRGEVFVVRVSFDTKEVALCDLGVTAAAAATPAPNTTPGAGGTLPAPVAGSAVTGGFELGGHVIGLFPNTVTNARAAGMTWVKKQMKGVGIDWARGIINDAKANGFKIMLSVVGDKNRLGTDFNNYVQEYSQLVAQVATAGADAIEVWNEPNIEREWPVGLVDGAQYTRLLAAAYNAIKTARPSTIVISGGPAPTGAAGTAGCVRNDAAGTHFCNDDTFMQQMAAAGAAQYMDCVGLHYNEGIVAPSVNSGDPRGSYPTYYFSQMLNRGYSLFGGKPVCWTEIGYLSGQGYTSPIPAGFAWAANTTVAQQASWLAEAATLSAQSGRVRIMIVWNVDFTRFDSDPQGGYAMMRPDGTCPACTALGAVMRR